MGGPELPWRFADSSQCWNCFAVWSPDLVIRLERAISLQLCHKHSPSEGEMPKARRFSSNTVPVRGFNGRQLVGTRAGDPRRDKLSEASYLTDCRAE